MARAITDISDLPPHFRAVRYRDLAAQALGYADRATTATMRDSYVLLAEHWCKLAEGIEADAARQAESPPYPSDIRVKPAACDDDPGHRH